MNNNPDVSAITVSELNRKAKVLLETGIPLLWISGELSNVIQPASGHLYFTLKDEHAQVRGAMFRGRNQHLNFQPQEGMQVLVRARVSIYEPRGDYQLIVEHMETAGDGLLRQQFEQLKQKLQSEGLFEIEHKQEIPALPTCIGVVTSPTGAAIRDVLHVLKRRCPMIKVILYPTRVQGKEAAQEIVQAINIANDRKECDVLIVGRGGGSLEDLWPFNEEVVARAIYASELPTISAVGHETDITISDFVADLRAPTPSAAAELASPDQLTLQQTMDRYEQQLARLLARRITSLTDRLAWLQRQLKMQHPSQQLRLRREHTQRLKERLIQNIQQINESCRSKLHITYGKLQQHRPDRLISAQKAELRHQFHLLKQCMQKQLDADTHALHSLSRTLDTISPLATLDRGYAIIRDSSRKKVISSITLTKENDTIEAMLKDGDLVCRVEKKIQRDDQS